MKIGARAREQGVRFGAAHRVTVLLVLALSILDIVAATLLGGGLAFVIGFVALTVLLPTALALAHLRREVEGNYQQGARDRTGMPVDMPRILRSRRVVGHGFFAAMIGVGVPLVALTALFFVLMPRMSLGGGAWLASLLGTNGDRIHFTDAISLRSDNRAPLSSDPSIALRFTTSDAPKALPRVMPMRFRGAVLESFDGRVWRSESALDLVAAPALRDPLQRAVRIERASFDPPGLLVPDGTTRLTDLERHGETAADYVAWVGASPDTTPSTPAASTLAVPTNASPRLRALAHEWTQAATTPRERSAALEARLRTTLRYDRASPARAASDPLDDFLFVSKRGHCELFAASMALMLREVGVPSRLVTGLVGGTLNAYGGFYTVKQGDALSHRWAPDVFGYDATSRSALLAQPRTLATIGIAALALLAAWLSIRWRLVGSPSLVGRQLRRLAARIVRGARQPDDASRPHDATIAYEALEHALAARGITRDPSTPPLAHAEALVAAGHPLGAEVLALTQLYLDARFGARPFASDARRAMDRRIALLLQPA